MSKQTLLEVTPVLMAEQQYWSEIATLPQLTRERTSSLVKRAYAGEDVRDEIILALQVRLYRMAGQVAYRESSIERLDLVQSATEAMIRQYERALTKREPISYLLRIARLTMIDCIRGRGNLIKTYQPKQKVTLLSLDMLLSDNPEGKVQAPLNEAFPRQASQKFGQVLLRQAIAQLPVEQRLIAVRHYGLGNAPEPLNKISRRLSPSSLRPSNAHYHHKQALLTLRQTLAPYFPQYGDSHSACSSRTDGTLLKGERSFEDRSEGS